VIEDNIFPKHIKEIVNKYIKNLPVEEIRFRVGRKLAFNFADEHILSNYKVTKSDIDELLNMMCQSSVYAYTDEIKNGFLTLDGGHRAGISGRAVLENGTLKNITDINGINLRIARELKGVALPYIDKIISKTEVKNSLIISPPGYGKTTVLRDITRILGAKHRVSLIDERCEISAISNGIPQYDVGEMTDIMELCPKQTASEIMLRSMSPEVIVMDEISSDDFGIIQKIISCGVKVIATAHGDNPDDTLKRLGIFNEFVVITLPKRR